MMGTKKSRPTLFLIYELLRDITVLIDLELKLAIAEIQRNIDSAKRGVIQLSLGLFLLLLALLLFTCSAVAALAIVLPLWLAALIVGALSAATGLLFLLAGKNRLSEASPLPNESIARIRTLSMKLKE
jgi:hypothetical protein